MSSCGSGVQVSPADLVEVRERELKFDVASDWSLPDLQSLTGGEGSIVAGAVRLVSTYFDTASRDLLAAGATLRRRTGDTDEGWQLKVPDGDARIEVRAEFNGGGIPTPLRELVLGVRAGEALKTLATLTTQRTTHTVTDPLGAALAEVAEDLVSAVVYAPRRRQTLWREVEVELIGGDEALLEQVRRELIASGAVRSRSSSKLARAVNGRQEAQDPDLSLAGLIHRYVAEQVQALMRRDIDLRRAQDVVHPTRVAIRRLRSALRVFSDVFEPDRAVHLNAELSWFAGLLGAVRDREVLRVRLDAAVADLPPAVVVGPVQARIDTMLGTERDAAEIAVTKAMTGSRYLALMRELKLWRDAPAYADDVRPTGAVDARVAAVTSTARKRVRKAAKHAQVDAAMHGARKAAKRARYTAELAEPKMGKKARAAIKEFTTIQDRLGVVQDSLVASEFLLRAAKLAQTAGESAVTFGALWAREQENARTALHI